MKVLSISFASTTPIMATMETGLMPIGKPVAYQSEPRARSMRTAGPVKVRSSYNGWDFDRFPPSTFNQPNGQPVTETLPSMT
jgi:hypothetical protein